MFNDGNINLLDKQKLDSESEPSIKYINPNTDKIDMPSPHFAEVIWPE